MTKPWKPTKEQLLAATEKTVRDVIAPDLRVLFCGINPGLYTAAVGHHFARPGNRFWPALCAGGFTDRCCRRSMSGVVEEWLRNHECRFAYDGDGGHVDERRDSCGWRAVASEGASLSPESVLAVLGVGAYRTAFNQPKASVGRQDDQIGQTVLWVLPNPSGLNANYQARRPRALVSRIKRGHG